jgi:hypothetical protein|tara:strand:- start:872 stop:991 length:120 start_codon:yes stop_codon:yes gene_type:complete
MAVIDFVNGVFSAAFIIGVCVVTSAVRSACLRTGGPFSR